MAALHTVNVALGDRSYDVVVAPGLEGLGDAVRRRFGRDHAVILTDDVVAPLWLDALQRELSSAGVRGTPIVVGAGEARKTRDTWWTLVDGILAAGVDRRTPVVALGGGVLGDLAGFAAASVNRGMPWVQVPTTLVAMVDSSVGGKTGFNHPLGKNLVGAFHQPSLVWAGLGTLDTLDPDERRAGMGEVVKTALLGDVDLFEDIERDALALGASTSASLGRIVARCVAVKARIVTEDERESGSRAVLNAGHTVGHAIEALLGFGTWRHGEAVAAGLVSETAWAVAAGHCLDASLPARLARLMTTLGLPAGPPDLPGADWAEAMRLDKKAFGDRLVVPVAVRLGFMSLVDVPMARAGELVRSCPVDG